MFNPQEGDKKKIKKAFLTWVFLKTYEKYYVLSFCTYAIIIIRLFTTNYLFWLQHTFDTISVCLIPW